MPESDVDLGKNPLEIRNDFPNNGSNYQIGRIFAATFVKTPMIRRV